MTFLDEVASQLVEKHGTDFKHIAVVLPSKRSSLFLKKSIASKVKKTFSFKNPTFYYEPRWSPDSKMISFYDEGRNLQIIDVESGKITRIDDEAFAHPVHVICRQQCECHAAQYIQCQSEPGRYRTFVSPGSNRAKISVACT